MALLLYGCSAGSNMKADILEANLTDTIPTQQFEVMEVMSGQKLLYDKAYNKAKNYYSPEEPVYGAVLAANLKSKEEIAGFFKRLEKKQHYQTIVLLTTVKSQQKAVAGNWGYKTPYGTLYPPANVLQNIDGGTFVKVDEALTKKEAWPAVIAPFVAKSFGKAEFLPVFVNEDATGSDTEILATWLHENLPKDTLVIAQTVAKPSVDPAVAEFQLKFTKNVLENFDNEKISTMPLRNTEAVEVLQKYLFKRKAQKMQNQFMDTQTGHFLSFSMEGPVYQSRSVFTVAFGDVMLDRLVRTHMNNNSPDYPFEKMDFSYLNNNDILIANLEGPIAKKKIQTSKEIAFRFNPDIVPVLQKYSFDALSEANNHAVDMGWTGFDDTFELLAPTGIKVFGHPKEIEARSVASFEIQEQKIAFLGLEDVAYKIDAEKAVAKIKELTEQGYKVIPFLHWGVEYQHKPNNRQRDLAHKFIDAGAVAVIGAHPHVIQTYETYNNRPIFYSLGNAIFDQYFSKDTQEGLSTALIVSNDQIEIYFLPIKLDKSQFRLMTGDERTEFLKRFVEYGEYRSEEERQNILSGKLTLRF